MTCANSAIWKSIQPTMLNLQTRLSNKSLADIHADEQEWPDATTLASVGDHSDFKALGVNVSGADLASFRLDFDDIRPSIGYVSGAAIDFALASLAVEHNSSDSLGPDIYHIGQHAAAVCSSFLRDITEETIVSAARRILKQFSPETTPTLIIPGNLLNMHWLFISMDFISNTATIWNSLNKALPQALNQFTATALLLAKSICVLVGLNQTETWKLREETVLQQENGHDCCLHVVCNCIRIAIKQKNQLTHAQVRSSRKWLLWKLLEHLPMEKLTTEMARTEAPPANLGEADMRANYHNSHQHVNAVTSHAEH
jgi:hypothetical protein